MVWSSDEEDHMSNNMSESVSKSVATKQNGTEDPEHISPIADAQVGGNARVVGFMYRGNGYGQNSAWITCDADDLKEVKR